MSQGETPRHTFSSIDLEKVKPLFQCLTCARCFVDQENLESHEVDHFIHVEEQRELSKKAKDSELKKESSTNRSITDSSKEKENEINNRIECELCGKTYKTKASAKTHIARFHERKIGIATSLQCNHCDQTFKSYELLRTHLSNVKKGLVYCTVCDRRYYRRDELRKHILFAHEKEKREFVCTICKKAFVLNCFLNRHIRHVHEKLKSVKCELCSKKFPQLQNLQKHFENVHLKLKPFTCEICGNPFAQKSSLGLHQKNIHKIDKRSNAGTANKTEILTA